MMSLFVYVSVSTATFAFSTDLHETCHTRLGSQREELGRLLPEFENIPIVLIPKAYFSSDQ